MIRQAVRCRRGAALLALVALAAAVPAAAQFITFPRVGVSAAPDHYESEVAVHGDELFELHVVLLPREDRTTLQDDYGMVQWAVLEACCGGAAEIVSVEFNPAYEHDGTPYAGVVTTAEECMSGAAVRLCTLTLRMATDVSGRYYVLAGPLSVARTCDQQDVVLTDLIAHVNYTNDATPVEPASLSAVKALFE